MSSSTMSGGDPVLSCHRCDRVGSVQSLDRLYRGVTEQYRSGSRREYEPTEMWVCNKKNKKKCKQTRNATPVVLKLGEYEAEELAGYLSGTFMKISIGDRLTIARNLWRQIKR